MRTVPFQPLDPALYREIVRRALAEDLGWGDVTTEATVAADLRARGVILAKSPCVIAGLDVAAEAFRQLDPGSPSIARRSDGDRCQPGDVVAELRGPAAPMLTAERTALNFLQRLSGIATLTRRFVDAAGGRITVLDTRKTTPTLRALEKYAVRAGGGTNHRAGLDDGVLIKDNHIRLAGGVAAAVQRMQDGAAGDADRGRSAEPRAVDEALAAGADIILVDNLPHRAIREAVRRDRAAARKSSCRAASRWNASRSWRATGADYVSVGALDAFRARRRLELRARTRLP